jgi:glycosyltransferase involved in cell wall biosynthesis
MPARLIIIGDGEDRNDLESLCAHLGIENSVAMPGYVPNPYCWMKRARVFVLSSKWEGFANVLAEALASGTPVVSTDCPSGPAEIISNEDYGKLVPVGDSKALALALAEIIEKPFVRETLMSRGMAFSIDEIAPGYLQLIERLGKS